MSRFNIFKILVITLFSLFASRQLSFSDELFIDPASPLVKTGEKIIFTSPNADGEPDDIIWIAAKGNISGNGQYAEYTAPDDPTVDMVGVLDCSGNTAVVTVVVMAKESIEDIFIKNNAVWELFTKRTPIWSMAFSDNKKSLWIGTNGGLEKRNVETGELENLYLKIDGMPDNMIYAVSPDGQGGLWAGTSGAIVHISDNGVFNKIYDKTTYPQFPDDRMSSIEPDGKGGVWIGSSGNGLFHIMADTTLEMFNEQNSGLSDNKIKTILSDTNGGIWVGTVNKGLFHLGADGTLKESYDENNSELPANHVSSLLYGKDDAIWIGTKGGIASLHSGVITKVDITDEQGENYKISVKAMEYDSYGGIWIGTDGSGLVHFSSENKSSIYTTNNSKIPDNVVDYLASDGQGRIWLAFYNHQVLTSFSYDVNKWKNYYDEKSSFQGIDIKSIQPDQNGGVWVGSWDYALAHLMSDNTWKFYDNEWNLCDVSVTDNSGSIDVDALMSDGKNGVWIGTVNNGLIHLFSDGRYIKYDKKQYPEIPDDNHIISLSRGVQGGIWVGTSKGLAYLSSKGDWKSYSQHPAFKGKHVSSILEDNKGGLWVGTIYGGLIHLLTDDTFKIYKKIGGTEETPFEEEADTEDFPHNHVTSIESDKKEGVWVGTEGGGIVHISSTGKKSVYDTLNSDIPDDHVTSLLSTTQGSLWIGTFSGLAFRSASGIWETYNTENSYLPDNHISSLTSDNNNGLWIGTQLRGVLHLKFSTTKTLGKKYSSDGKAAIIIAGGGNKKNNALWDSTAKISNYIYRMLNKRGFLNTDIHYISPIDWADFDGNGSNDKIVDAPNPSRYIQVSDIQAAFDWAKTKGKLNQPLYIFFIDHGGDGLLVLELGEVYIYIEAVKLKAMLDDYQKVTGNKVVFVIDACSSGTMVKALAGENRAVISSTGEGKAYFDRLNGQSFIWYISEGLDKGMNFSEAFYYASGKYKESLVKISQYESISKDIDTVNLTQEPQFDDNGDGVYNISADGNWLEQISVNGPWSIADVTLTVEAVTKSSTIPASNSAVSGSGGASLGAVPLKAKATLANGRINRVWAVIRPPQMDILVDDTGIPLLAFPKVDLSALKAVNSNEVNSNTEEQNIYEGSWNGFVYNGEYEITFYAQDNEGNIENSKSIKLTVTDGMACPEKASLKVSMTEDSANDSDGNPYKTGKIVYKTGDTLKISVTENLAYGYDLYLTLIMPDGNFVALKNPLTDLNQLQKENFNRLYWGDRWIEINRNINMGKDVGVVDMVLSESMLSQSKLPQGKYCLYAALIPAGEDLVVSAEKGLFVLNGVCFDVSVQLSL